MIYMNGKLLPANAGISTQDRGLLLGDGVFETMRVYQGNVFCLERHWHRLMNSLKLLKISMPLTYQQLEEAIHLVLGENKLTQSDAALRLTVTRGCGPRGINLPGEISPTYFLCAYSYQNTHPKPLNLRISNIRKNEYSPLCKIKSLNYLENILARMEALENEADEALFLNTAGHIVETCIANVFIVLQEQVLTPRIEDGALPGVTRGIILDLCRTHRLLIDEVSISEEMLFNATEMFVTNSLVGLQAVNKINDKVFAGENSVTERLRMLYQGLTNFE